MVPPGRHTVQYRLYCQVRGQVFTDGVLHQFEVPADEDVRRGPGGGDSGCGPSLASGGSPRASRPRDCTASGAGAFTYDWYRASAAAVDSHSEGWFSNWLSKVIVAGDLAIEERSPSRHGLREGDLARVRRVRVPSLLAPRRFGRPAHVGGCTAMGCSCSQRRICRGAREFHGRAPPRQRLPLGRTPANHAVGRVGSQYPIERDLHVRGADVRHPFLVVWHAWAPGRRKAKPRRSRAGVVGVADKAHEDCVKYEPYNAIAPYRADRAARCEPVDVTDVAELAKSARNTTLSTDTCSNRPVTIRTGCNTLWGFEGEAAAYAGSES